MFPNEADIQVTYYYGVVYFDNGEASVSRPFPDKDACMDAIKKGVAKHPDRVVATSFMTRKVNQFLEPPSTKDLFGCPDSRNVMKDKKFLAEITAE